MLRSKFHRPWQPRMSDGQMFNPFVRSAEPELALNDRQRLDDLEAEEIAQQNAAEVAGLDPIQSAEHLAGAMANAAGTPVPGTPPQARTAK